jgi:hypothetical protein
MRLTHRNERPSAFTAACAHAHALRVGRVAVLGVPTYRGPLAEQPVAFTNQFKQQKSVQLQDARVRFQGTNGLTQAIRMAQSPIALSPSARGVKVSGVPPRGRPV